MTSSRTDPAGFLEGDGLRVIDEFQKAGKEVDFVLEGPDGRGVGVEVKAARSLGVSDARPLAWMRDRIGSDFVQGVVRYTGEEVLPLGDRITALPVSALWSAAPASR